MPVTIKDIAKKAGVSHTTVSRALNGNPAISEKTALGIRDIALEMGYLASAAARGLKTNRSRVLGVIVSRIDNPYFGEIVQGIEETVHPAGYSIFIASSNQDSEHERTIIQAFGEHRVDGVIIGSISFNREHSNMLHSYGIPIVVINNQSPNEYHHSIAHDDVYGARQVTRHLVELGHRRIAYLGNELAKRINRDRENGLKKEAAEASILIPPEYLVGLSGGEIEHGEKGMEDLLQRKEYPTAVFCFNDLMAIGALKVLHKHGLRVPEDISVAGFDNISYSAYTTPALTTFDQPKRLIGAEAANMLLELVNHAQAGTASVIPATRTIRGKLLIRESTGKCVERSKS